MITAGIARRAIILTPIKGIAINPMIIPTNVPKIPRTIFTAKAVALKAAPINIKNTTSPIIISILLSSIFYVNIIQLIYLKSFKALLNLD